MPSIPLLAHLRSQSDVEQCRSVYLWQGDPAEFKERDTKKWTEFHDVETFTKEMPDGKTFWGIKLPKPCKHPRETKRQIERPLASLSADSAYDTEGVYSAAEAAGAGRSPRVLIPPKKNALVNPNLPSLAQRNRNIRSRAKVGKRERQKQSGYSQRALVENAVHRYKVIVGPAMRSRTLAGQRAEARLGRLIVNRMTSLGMPDSCRVE